MRTADCELCGGEIPETCDGLADVCPDCRASTERETVVWVAVDGAGSVRFGIDAPEEMKRFVRKGEEFDAILLTITSRDMAQCLDLLRLIEQSGRLVDPFGLDTFVRMILPTLVARAVEVNTLRKARDQLERLGSPPYEMPY